MRQYVKYQKLLATRFWVCLTAGDFITFQVRDSSLKITSIYTHFAREKKRAMAEKLLVYSNEQFVLNRELR